MNVEIGNETQIFLFWEFLFRNFGILSLQSKVLVISVDWIHAFRARIFKLLRSPESDIKESIPPASVAWRAGTITLFLLGS